MPDPIKTLTDEQLAAFHTEYVRGPRWLALLANIQRDFPEGRFRFLDIGRGNGMLADKLLEHFPHATRVVLDNSRLLLAKNTTHPRKQLVCASVTGLAALPKQHYDLIFLNWVLHHLVSPTYQRTTQNQHEALAAAVQLVAQGGRLAIFENMYEGVLFENLPGYLIFQLTSAPLLAGTMGRFGANTAGVGVCFRSQRSWEQLLTAAGLEILTISLDPKPWKFTRFRKAALHIRSVRAALFWTQVKPV